MTKTDVPLFVVLLWMILAFFTGYTVAILSILAQL